MIPLRVIILLTSLALITGCSKEDKQVEVSGQIFVVTKGRENIKMGLVGLHVLTEEELKPIATTIWQMKKEKRDGEPHDSPEFKTDLILSLFSMLPPPMTKSDADGRFTIRIRTNVWLFAHAERSIGDTNESYMWALPIGIEPAKSPSPILVSNDNLLDVLLDVDGAFKLLSFLGKVSDHFPPTVATGVYAEVIRPIFQNRCIACHGGKKSKGGLRLDTLGHLLKGGDSGSCLEPANAEESLLGKRINLPIDDDDHMPPDGKPQLSESQLTVLRWWLDAGAPTDKMLSELKPSPEILHAIQSYKWP